MDGGASSNGFHGLPSFNYGTPAPDGGSSHLVQDGTAAANAIVINDASPAAQQQQQQQQVLLPITNVLRIMRKALPSHAKISEDAKVTVQECVSEFIRAITSEANRQCKREERKIVTSGDLFCAMSKLGFNEYIEPLTIYLNGYRNVNGGIRTAPLLLPKPTFRVPDLGACYDGVYGWGYSGNAPMYTDMAPDPMYQDQAAYLRMSGEQIGNSEKGLMYTGPMVPTRPIYVSPRPMHQIQPHLRMLEDGMYAGSGSGSGIGGGSGSGSGIGGGVSGSSSGEGDSGKAGPVTGFKPYSSFM